MLCRWQFGLRTALTATAAAALCFVWWTAPPSTASRRVVFEDLTVEFRDTPSKRWLTTVRSKSELERELTEPEQGVVPDLDFDTEYFVVLEGLLPRSVHPAEYAALTRLRGRVMFFEVEPHEPGDGSGMQGTVAPNLRTRTWISVPRGIQVWLVTPAQRFAIDMTAAVAFLALFFAPAASARWRKPPRAGLVQSQH